jgi:hypothetical protein
MDLSTGDIDPTYKGFIISGSARLEFAQGNHWSAVGSVLLIKPPSSCLLVKELKDPLLVYEDEDFAKMTGWFLAELAVDHILPPPAYYLAPMNTAWAVDILRRSAEQCKTRNIQTPKLFEALDYLEQTLESKGWLVRRYRRALKGDRRNHREKARLREELVVATRGIQHACVELILDRMNDLAVNYRENKARIDRLRHVLEIVRKPVRRDQTKEGVRM